MFIIQPEKRLKSPFRGIYIFKEISAETKFFGGRLGENI